MCNCVFCDILADRRPGSFVHRDELVGAFLDIHPLNSGHVLIAPRRHAARLADLTEDEADRMMTIARRIERALAGSSDPPDGCNLLLADGPSAGQEVAHVHLHVVPRWTNDGTSLTFRQRGGSDPVRSQLDAIAADLRERLSEAGAPPSVAESSDGLIHATLCFLLRDGDPPHVLLGRKKRGFGLGKLNGLGGKLQPGESLEDAVCREVHEEVGVTVLPGAVRHVGRLTFRFPARPDFDHLVDVFVARSWQREPVESEEMAPTWVPVDALPLSRMWQDDAIWLPIVLAGGTVVGSFEYGDDNETVTRWRLESATPTRWDDRRTRILPFGTD